MSYSGQGGIGIFMKVTYKQYQDSYIHLIFATIHTLKKVVVKQNEFR